MFWFIILNICLKFKKVSQYVSEWTWQKKKEGESVLKWVGDRSYTASTITTTTHTHDLFLWPFRDEPKKKKLREREKERND